MRSEAWGIFWGVLLCGVMDITAALVVYGLFGLRPQRLLQGIAAGVLGAQSYQGDGERRCWDCFCIL